MGSEFNERKSLEMLVPILKLPSVCSYNSDQDSVFEDIGEIRTDDCFSLDARESLSPEPTSPTDDHSSLTSVSSGDTDGFSRFGRSSNYYSLRQRRVRMDYMRLRGKTDSLRQKDLQLRKRQKLILEKAEEVLMASPCSFDRGRFRSFQNRSPKCLISAPSHANETRRKSVNSTQQLVEQQQLIREKAIAVMMASPSSFVRGRFRSLQHRSPNHATKPTKHYACTSEVRHSPGKTNFDRTSQLRKAIRRKHTAVVHDRLI